MQSFMTYLDQLACLFEQMDQAYGQVCRQSGFVCRGCQDNCCGTRFYHHTLIEYLYLKVGLDSLSEQAREAVRQRADQAHHQMRRDDAQGRKQRIMCPLNQDGRCILYARRPMICRLHGVPHQLRRPDGRLQIGPGCGDFELQCPGSVPARLDRTPLYTTLADLERRLRQRTGVMTRIRMTVAEMLVDESIEIPGLLNPKD